MRNWKETVDIKQWLHSEEELGFDEIRDSIVATIKASRWYKRQEESGFVTLYLIVEELADADDENDFNRALFELYDEADADSVWLGA